MPRSKKKINQYKSMYTSNIRLLNAGLKIYHNINYIILY